MYDYKEWRHVFKVDPNKEISEQDLERICDSGTDAIIVGGTDGITEDNVLHMLARIRRFLVPCVLEVSSIDAVVPGFDLYFIPSVVNSRSTNWVVDLHHSAMKEFGEIINWDEIVVEGYCIVNPDCKAAVLTDAKTDLTEEDLVAYAHLVDKMFHMPIFYLEYSGMYGDPKMVKKCKASLQGSKLFYGGGIETVEQAVEMAKHADTIVVGNIIYEDIDKALKTVQAVKNKLD